MRPIRDLTEGGQSGSRGRLQSARSPYSTTTTSESSRPPSIACNKDWPSVDALHTAFGTYVDPALAARLEQGDDIFRGEHRHVTTLFIDIRDFTAYADSPHRRGSGESPQ